VNIPKLALPVEDLLRPFPAKTERFGEWAQQLNDLGDVIIVFPVFSARLRVK